jgi:hypothetical protein
MAQFRVETQNDVGLRLRSEPNGSIMMTLPEGQLVDKLEEIDATWWRVRVSRNGTPMEGFVAARFLVRAGDFHGPDPAHGITAVHLREHRPEVTRDSVNFRAFPLGEPAMPGRTAGTAPERAAQLSAIIDFLDVENRRRYAPAEKATFCNIYVYDYCYLAGIYIPRVCGLSLP